mgnify:CR=1 FL=1
MERIVLHTDQAKFELAVQQYGRVADLKMRIKKELKILLPKLKVNEDFFSNVMENFWEELGKAHPKHLELMHPNKIPGLLDLDIKLLQSLANEFDLVKDTKNPSISSYQVLKSPDRTHILVGGLSGPTGIKILGREKKFPCPRGRFFRRTPIFIMSKIANIS